MDRKVVILVAATVALVGGPLVLVRVLNELYGSDRPCYAASGPEGLAIRTYVTTKRCHDSFPWIANVMDPFVQTHQCSGILVKPNVVIVPAQCINSDPSDKILYPLVRLGSYNLNRDDGNKPEDGSMDPLPSSYKWSDQ